MRGTASEKRRVGDPTPGGFTLRGSWNDEGRPDSPLIEFVRLCRRERRDGNLTTAEFCDRILTTFMDAFPNREQWRTCQDWSDCKTSTSAESSIVYAFTSKSGEPSATSFSYDPDSPMSQTQYLGNLSTVAERISHGCALYGHADPYDPVRMQMHRAHGEMVAAGISDHEEVVRVIASRLKGLKHD